MRRVPRNHPPVLLVMAAFSRYESALDWARERGAAEWGPIFAASEPFAFEQTSFYDGSMGRGLKKQIIAFEGLVDPLLLPDMKCTAISWEQEYAASFPHTESRPLNLDPGYLTPGKLVLASTKDHAHRIYLRDGIYAEVTLHYQEGAWRARPWTFPDYADGSYFPFLSQCREELLSRARGDRDE